MSEHISVNGKDHGQELKQNVKKALDRTLDQAQSRVNDAVSTAVDTAGEYYQSSQKMMADAAKTSVNYTKRNPVRVIVGAAAMGFTLGFLLRRSFSR